jgi:hypothetical protein
MIGMEKSTFFSIPISCHESDIFSLYFVYSKYDIGYSVRKIRRRIAGTGDERHEIWIF